MTQPNQSELEQKIFSLTVETGRKFMKTRVLEDWTLSKQIMELVNAYITADRKRVELEARIDENNMYIRELTRHYFPSSPSEPHIPLVQFYERIAELKAKQEEV